MNLSEKSLSQEMDENYEEYEEYSEPADEIHSGVSEESNGAPQQQEIEDYARFLGMDPQDSIDWKLLWIAKQGLQEPVPHPWQILQQPNDDIIYYNSVTKERTSQHPMDQHYRNLYLHEREKITTSKRQVEVKVAPQSQQKQPPILIEGDSQPKNIFSQNTTIGKIDHSTFSGQSFPLAAVVPNTQNQLIIKGKELELQIICDAFRRNHDESLAEMEANNKFMLECLEQDIETQFQVRNKREQSQLLNELAQRQTQRLNIHNRELNIRRDRIRNEFESQRDDEMQKQKINHDLLIRQLKLQTDQSLKSTTASSTETQQLLNANNQYEKLLLEINNLKDQGHQKLREAKIQIQKDNQAELDSYRQQLMSRLQTQVDNLGAKNKAKIAEQRQKLDEVDESSRKNFELMKRELKVQMQAKLQRRKLELQQFSQHNEILKIDSIRLLEAKKNESYHKIDLQHQQQLSALECQVYSSESYRLENQVNLIKEKQLINQEFTNKFESLQKEARLYDVQVESHLKLLSQTSAQKQLLKDMRNQVFELDSTFSTVMKERCDLQMKIGQSKQKGHQNDSNTEILLTRELEAKRMELQQIQDQTTKCIKEGSVRNATRQIIANISDLKAIVSNVTLQKPNQQEKTNNDEIRDLIPREITKIKQAIKKNSQESSVMEELQTDLSNDLFSGIGNSIRAIEFKSSMQQEQTQINLEVIRLQTQRQALEQSLATLQDIEKEIKTVSYDQNQIQEQFSIYVRQRVSLKHEFKSQSIMKKESDFLTGLMQN